MPDNAQIIAHTQKWLSTVVIAHNLCPFAKREYDLGRIHYEVIEAVDIESQLEKLILGCAALDNNSEIETSLLIYPAVSDFEDYLNLLNLLDLGMALIKAQGYEGIYQLASFHPDYCFEGVAPNDASNYTNRSPYPMLHILREASIEAALKTYPNPEEIPARNITRTQRLGARFMESLLKACREDL